MATEPNTWTDFRRRLSHLRTSEEARWNASRKLVENGRARRTLDQLIRATQHSSLSVRLKQALVEALGNGQATGIQHLAGDPLKELTGLPPTKAVRVLCVLFGLTDSEISTFPVPQSTSLEVELFVRHHRNPFDLLLETDVASVLDLGAGDLSFASELAGQYVPQLEQRKKELLLHSVDRLAPGSQLGGPLHPDDARLKHLRTQPGLCFQFHGNRDMFDLEALVHAGHLPSRYTIATCWAPATPTFAYEPTRLSPDAIHEDLRRTRGVFRKTRVDGEEALEVRHGDRSLLFPPWKFEIRGPLSLLDVLSRRGLLGILGAVDGQVFWELLAQVLADSRYRPDNTLFTPPVLPTIFGEVYEQLTRLPLGQALNLADIAAVRTDLPCLLDGVGHSRSVYRFRHIEIRRGAVFEGIPSSSTARLFQGMVEESPPWFVTLVPDRQIETVDK